MQRCIVHLQFYMKIISVFEPPKWAELRTDYVHANKTVGVFRLHDPPGYSLYRQLHPPLFSFFFVLFCKRDTVETLSASLPARILTI